MKNIWMTLKLAFLVVSLFIATDNFKVLADGWEETESSCNTNNSCSWFQGRGCWCSDLNNCNGCYLPNGGGGAGECGTCFKSP
jgi:hypothetical protein